MRNKSLTALVLALFAILMLMTQSAFAQNERSVAGLPARESYRGTERPVTPPKSAADVDDKLKALEEELRAQAQKLEEMRAIITNQQKVIETLSAKSANSEQKLGAQTGAVAAQPANATAPVASRNIGPQGTDTGDAPLSFRIGSASITPVGFLDFTTVYRSTNVGSGIGTNFGSVPLSNTTQGKLSEVRLSAQNARIGFRVDAKVRGASVIGYFESDFLGNNPGNVAVSSNSDTNRLRLYWADVRKGKFEFLGGQSWSMLTPGRNGISPLPGDLFFSQNVDVNYQAGLVWARDPQFRMVYHPSARVALGLSLENPEQYIGGSAGGGAVTLPTGLAASYGAELNNGGNTLAVPNLLPDVVVKLAFDPKVGKRDLHIEAAGLFREFKVFNPISLQHFSATGGGGSVNVNFELVKNFRFLSNNFFSDGGGRYIFGQAPDLIARGDGSLSLLHSYSTVTGFEATIRKNTLLYGYYGGVYIGRNVVIDPANGKFVGYGFPGSPAGQNRSIQEATFGFTQTFWKDAKYGALQFMGQYSYLVRHPWSVAPGGLTAAHTNMLFLNLRYALPGSAPKPK